MNTYPHIQFARLFTYKHLDKSTWFLKLYRKLFGNKKAEYFVHNDRQQKTSSVKIYFTLFLKNEFDHKIHTNGCILGEDGKILYHDIMYLDYENNIFFVVKIDEPYDLVTGSIENVLNSSELNSQTKELLDHNFNIIRFSEEQIIKQPGECLNLVKEFIDVLQGSKSSIGIDVIKSVVSRPMWSKEDAEMLKLKGYRESYLNEFNSSTTIIDYM